ncbi:MAG: acyl-CoA reductase [Bacteroidales bacterium]
MDTFAPMKLEERISAFSRLGEIISEGLHGRGPYHEKISLAIRNQHLVNPWFTPENVRLAFESIAYSLGDNKLVKWINKYPGLPDGDSGSCVALVMAGNIPLVGFHDFITVLISGNKVLARKSSKDPDLIELIADILKGLNEEFSGLIEITDGKISNFDLVIATGSDNTSRYFEYYFKKYPRIIRGNRNSVAVITGEETTRELGLLGNDIFTYFGLGCRNVSRLYLPVGYDIKPLIQSWDKWEGIINHVKYANNYDYYKAVFLVNREPFLDSGYILLHENSSLASPVGVINFSYYNDRAKLEDELTSLSPKIQCIVGHGYLPFGTAQYPELWDYADGTDTLDFILKKIGSGIS